MEMDDFRLRMRKEIKEDMEVSSLRVSEAMMKWKIDFGIETEDSVPIFDGQQLMHRVGVFESVGGEVEEKAFREDRRSPTVAAVEREPTNLARTILVKQSCVLSVMWDGRLLVTDGLEASVSVLETGSAGSAEASPRRPMQLLLSFMSKLQGVEQD